MPDPAWGELLSTEDSVAVAVGDETSPNSLLKSNCVSKIQEKFITFYLHYYTIYVTILPKHIFLFTFDKAIHFSRHRKIYALNSKKYN